VIIMAETKKKSVKKTPVKKETKTEVKKEIQKEETKTEVKAQVKHEEKTGTKKEISHAEKKESNEVKDTEKKKDAKAKVEHKKEVKKKKYLPKVKKENKKKSKEALEVQKTLQGKKKLPTFRGRFGKKNIRRKSNKKWQKWRKPRSIDLDRGLQHGYTPKIGYRSKTELRDIHPSGYKEVFVKNLNNMEGIDSKTQAIRISATVGKRKRNDIVTKANEKGIWVLN